MFKRILTVALVFIGIFLYLGVCSAANDTKAEIERDAYRKYVVDLYSQDAFYNMPDFDNYDDYVNYVNNLDIEYEPFVSDFNINYSDDAIFDNSKVQIEEFYLPDCDNSDEQIYLSTLYKPSLSDDDYKLFYSLNLTPTEYVSKMSFQTLDGEFSDLFFFAPPRGDFLAVLDDAFLSESAKEKGYKYLRLACRTDYLFVPRFLIVDGKEHLIFNVYVKKDSNRDAHVMACAGSDITRWDYYPLYGSGITTNEAHVMTTITPGSDDTEEWVELCHHDVPFYMFPIAWNGQFCNVGLPQYDSQGNIERCYIGGNNNTVYCFYISFTKTDNEARSYFEAIGYDYRHYMIAHVTSDSSKIASQNEDSVVRLRYAASHMLASTLTDIDLTEYLPIAAFQAFKSGLISYGTSLLNAVPELDGLVAPLSFLFRGVGIIIGSADGVISDFGINFFVSVAVISIFISLLGICLGFYTMLSSQSISIARSYTSKKPVKRKIDLSVWDYEEIKKHKELTSNDVKQLKGGD